MRAKPMIPVRDGRRRPAWSSVLILCATLLGQQGAAGVLASEPDNVAAGKLLADLDQWGGNPPSAAESDLEPQDQAQTPSIGERMAILVRDRIHGRPDRPGSEAAAGHRVRYRAMTEYFLQAFDKEFADWHQFNIGLERETARGSIIGRAGYYNRFADSAGLFEVEWYPTIRAGTYAYLNAGVSTQDHLPDYQLAAELYQALPFNLEGSFGWRQVHFDSSANTLTGSIGYYVGNYWFLVRPLVTVVSGDSSTSWVLRGRRYFADEEEYLTLTFAHGSSLEGDAATQSLFELDTTGGMAEGRKRLTGHTIGKLALGWESQERRGRDDRGQLTFGFGLDYLF